MKQVGSQVYIILSETIHSLMCFIDRRGGGSDREPGGGMSRCRQRPVLSFRLQVLPHPRDAASSPGYGRPNLLPDATPPVATTTNTETNFLFFLLLLFLLSLLLLLLFIATFIYLHRLLLYKIIAASCDDRTNFCGPSRDVFNVRPDDGVNALLETSRDGVRYIRSVIGCASE